MLFLFEHILNPLLGMSLTAAFVAVVVILLRLILKKRAPKQVVCLLWLVVFARLLIPVMVESPISLVPSALENIVQTEQPEEPVNTPVVGETQSTPALTPGNVVTTPTDPVVTPPVNSSTQDPVTSSPVGEEPPVLEAPSEPESPAETPVGEELVTPIWMYIVPAVWLTGVAVMLVVGIGSYVKLRRQVYDAIRTTDGVWEHPSLGSPFILGLIRPKIYLPMGIEGQSRKFILHHERAHLRRLDHVVKPICWLALAIHWFNPLAWAAFMLMSRDIETACDESVIRQLGSEVKADYSATLLALATDKRFPAPSPLSFGEGDAKVRIKNVLSFKKPALWVSVVATVVVIVAAVCLLTNRSSTVEDGFLRYSFYPDTLGFVNETDEETGHNAYLAYRLDGKEPQLVAGWASYPNMNYTALIHPDGTEEHLYIATDLVIAMYEQYVVDAAQELDSSWVHTLDEPRKETPGLTYIPIEEKVHFIVSDGSDSVSVGFCGTPEGNMLLVREDKAQVMPINYEKSPTRIVTSDLDGDGQDELALCWTDALKIYNYEGTPQEFGFFGDFMCVFEWNKTEWTYAEYRVPTQVELTDAQIIWDGSGFFVRLFYGEQNITYPLTYENGAILVETEDDKPAPGEGVPGTITPIDPATMSSAREMFLSALNDKVEIIHTGLGMTDVLSKLVEATAPTVEMKITKMAAVDLDSDGIKELLLLLETPGTVYGTKILRYNAADQQIYAYDLWLRAFNEVKTDGTFSYSASSAVGGIARISFNPDGYGQERITYSEGEGNQYSFYVNKQPATEREYEAAREEWQAQPGVTWVEYTSENTDLLLRENFAKGYDPSLLTRIDALPDEGAVLYADAAGQMILQAGEYIGPISDDVWPVTATGFSVTLAKTDSGSIALRCRNQATSGLDVSVPVIWSSETGVWVRNGESIDNSSKELPRELVTPDTLPTDPEEYYLVAALPESHVYLYAKNHGEDSLLLWNGNFWWPLKGRTAHTPRMNLPRLYLMDENAQSTTVAAISERASGTEVSVEQLVVYVMGEHQVDSSYYTGLRQSIYDWSSIHEAFNSKKNTLVYDADTNSFTVFWNGRVYNSGELPQDVGQQFALEDGYTGSLFASGNIIKYTYVGGNRFTVTVKTAIEDWPLSPGVTGLDLTWTVEFNGEGFDLVGEISLGSAAEVNQMPSEGEGESPNGVAKLPNDWKMDDFIVAGFDKDGLGDFGYRAILSEDELKSLPELLDLSEWQELAYPPEYGLTVCLALSDSDAGRFLYILDGVDGKAAIKLMDQDTGESFVYLASEECITYAKALAAVLQDRAT